MKNLFEQYKWLKIIFGIVLFSLGLMTLIIALNKNGDELVKIICLMIAIYCFVNAIFIATFALLSEKKVGFNGISGDLLISGVIIGVGVAFCFVDQASAVIGTIVQYCLPLILIALGAVILVKFILLVSNPESRSDHPAWVRSLVAWIILLTVGIVFWIEKGNIIDIIYIIIGGLIMVVGVLVIVAAIITLVKDRKIKQIESK